MKTRQTIFNYLLCMATDLVRKYHQTSLGFAKIKAVFYYVKAIKVVRSVYIGIFLFILSFIVMINGFMFLHVSFLYYFPLSKEVKTLIIFSLGIFYFVIPIGALLYFTSQRVWMKLSKANKLVDKVLDRG